MDKEISTKICRYDKDTRTFWLKMSDYPNRGTYACPSTEIILISEKTSKKVLFSYGEGKYVRNKTDKESYWVYRCHKLDLTLNVLSDVL